MVSCEHNKSMVCNCTYKCPRRGKCCACLAYHVGNGEFPACFFSTATEKKYDRSFAALKRDRGSA